MRSQLAHFDDSGRGRAAEQQEREMYAATVTPVEAVPATYATVYAPNDPNADWGVRSETCLFLPIDWLQSYTVCAFFIIL